MQDTIIQEGTALSNVVEDLKKDAETYNKLITSLYNEIENNIGKQYDINKSWWGPKASVFLENAKSKKADFEKAYQDLINIANNLDEQMSVWDNFEV